MGKNIIVFSAMAALLVICGASLIEACSDSSPQAAPKPAPPRPPRSGSVPPPWVGSKPPPEPVKGLWNFLRHCAATLTNDCGQVVYDYVFYARKDIDTGCCQKLLKMGETCNKAAAYGLSHVPLFKRWRGNIYERSIEAYNYCLKKNGPHLD